MPRIVWPRIIARLHIAAILLYIGVIAYLGVFTRYMSDDFCETVMVTESTPVKAVVDRYLAGQWRAANRYSNLLFVGILEMAGPQNIRFGPPIMILLWIAGLIWLMSEIRKSAGIQWAVVLDIFVGLMVGFFSIYEAPNRFQILYWRSSMATHFVPFVFLNLLIAGLLRLLRFGSFKISAWMGLLLLVSAFLIGGFSEPTVTVLITGSGLSILFVWLGMEADRGRPALNSLGWILAGSTGALAVMAFSPAVANLNNGSLAFSAWVFRTVQYTYLFLLDTINKVPLPIAFNILIPALLFMTLNSGADEYRVLDRQFERKPGLLLLAASAVVVVLIAAGFSASAYGQSYPVDRSRFFAYYLLSVLCLLWGIVIGVGLSRVKNAWVRSSFTLAVAMLVLIGSAGYPLRAAVQELHNIPEYLERAALWDARDAYVRRQAALGETDIVVPGFSGVYAVKEWDDSETHWVNLCAAQYYGVKSIRAVSVEDETIWDFFRGQQ